MEWTLSHLQLFSYFYLVCFLWFPLFFYNSVVFLYISKLVIYFPICSYKSLQLLLPEPLLWHDDSWMLEVTLMSISHRNRPLVRLWLLHGVGLQPLSDCLSSTLTFPHLFILLPELPWDFRWLLALQIPTAMGTSAATSWMTCSRLLACLCLGTEWEKSQKTWWLQAI